MTTPHPDTDRLPELFDRACDLEGEALAVFLERECGDDAALRARLEELLVQDTSDQGALLDSRLGGELLAAAPAGGGVELAPGALVGRYRVLRRIGAGGMGTVYEAQQDEPRRNVALKVLRAGMTSPELLRRFRHEARILARLRHPGIAQVLEAGTFEDGSLENGGAPRPFIAMELIDGVPLTQYAREQGLSAREQGLSTRERLELFAQVCDAAHHAHSKGVVHRDLKPPNILVEPDGRTKVLDFGVARVVDDDTTLLTLHTRPGQLLGTLPYMSPEQVGGDPLAVDLRSDVYALGVILCELLSGRLPYDLSRKSLPEAARIIREREPTRLSKLDATLRGDLSIVVERALAKEPARRYASADALGADVRRHLAGESIHARATTALERATRFVRRYPALTAATLVTLAALSVGLAVSISKTAEARAAREETEQHLRVARLESCRATIAAAAASLRTGDPVMAESLLESVPEAQRAWEWSYYRAQLDRSLAVVPPEAGVLTETWSEEPGVLLTVTRAGHLQRRGLPDLAVSTQETLGNGEFAAASFSRDGERLALVRVDRPRAIELWELRPPHLLVSTPGSEANIHRLRVDDHGRRVAFTDDERDHWVWDLRTGEVAPLHLGKSDSGGVGTIDFRGDLIAVPGRYGTTILIELSEQGGSRTRIYRQGRQHSAAWSSDATLLALGGVDRAIGLYDTGPGSVAAVELRHGSPRRRNKEAPCLRELEGHQDAVSALEFSVDGERIVSGSRDRTVRVWELASGRCLRVLTGHEQGVVRLALAPTGGLCVSADQGGSLRLWDLELEPEVETLRGHESYVYDVAVSPSGETAASGSWDGTLRLWEIASGRELERIEVDSRVSTISWSPDGRYLVVGATWHELAVYDARQLGPARELETRTLRTLDLAWLDGGERLLAVGNVRGESDGGSCTRILDLETGALVGELEGPSGALRSVAVSADQRWIATGERAGAVHVHDGRTLERVWSVDAHDGNVFALAFDPSGRRLASAAADGGVGVWDVEGGRLLTRTAPHPDKVWDLGWTPDGRRIATACHDGLVRLFEPGTGLMMAQLRGHADYVHGLAFTADGRCLVTGSGDRTVRLWDTRPFRARWQERWRAERR